MVMVTLDGPIVLSLHSLLFAEHFCFLFLFSCCLRERPVEAECSLKTSTVLIIIIKNYTH